MTISANIYEVSIVIIAIALVIFIIVAIPVLLQLKRTIKAVEELTVESRKTAESLNYLLKKAAEEVEDLDELVKNVKNAGLKVTGAVDMVMDQVKSPLVTVLSLILGVEKGLMRFFRKDTKGGVEDDNQ